MKRKIICVLIAAMSIGMAGTVFAIPSISQLIPEAPTVVEGNLKEDEKLAVDNANPDKYTNKKVSETVKWANDDATVTTVKEILEKIEKGSAKKAATETVTSTGKKVNPTLYEQLTPFVDLVIKKNENVTYTSDGSIKAQVTVDAAIGMKKKELLVMQLDPETGKAYFSTVEKLNRKTGEMTVTFETLGPFSVLKTAPIVVKDVSPEDYKDKKTAETVTKFLDEKKDIELSDVLKEMNSSESGEEKPVENEIQISDNLTINIEDYSSSMGFADMAIKQGQDGYLYDMEGNLDAEVHRDIQDVDWERMVASMYPEYDLDEAKEDLSRLEELDSFVLKNAFIMQLNPITGEAEYISEPEISFEFSRVEEDYETEEEDTDDEDGGWKIEGENKEDKDNPNVVIRGEYKSMGPFAVFMQKETQLQ